MRRALGILMSSALMLATLAAPAAVAAGGTTQVDCRSGADLQAALDAAGARDTLVIRGTCVGNFTVPVELTLEGRGPRPTIRGLSGAPAISNREALTIRRLTVARGSGISAGGPLTVIASTIRDSEGDGISVSLGVRSMVMRDSVVRDNAGIGAWGTAQRITRSTFRGNGGVGLMTGGDASISRSVFTENAGGGIVTLTSLGYGYGGVITITHSRITRNGGSGIRNGHPTIIRHTLIRGNHTTGVGGGIYNDYNGGLTLIDSRVVKNSAIDGGGIYEWADAPGGINLIRRSVIRNNTPNDCVGC